MRHLNAPVPDIADIRPEVTSLDPVLAAVLDKNPDDRFVCCADYARAFTETAAPQTLRVAAAPTTPSLGTTLRPFCIDAGFLFDAEPLHHELEERGVKIGVATGVQKVQWDAAIIDPRPNKSPAMPRDYL